MSFVRLLKSPFSWLALIVLVASQAQAQLPQARLTSIYPPGGKQGTETEVSVAGSDLDEALQLLFSHPGITAAPKMLEPDDLYPEPRPVAGQFVVTIAADVPPGVYEARCVGQYGMSNPRAFMVGDLEEVLSEGNNQSIESAQEVEPGSVINGRTKSEAFDMYKIKLAKGQRVVIDCWAERIDSRADATLMLCAADGSELALSRVYNGLDPLIDFTAPAEGEYIVRVYDFLYGGGAEHFYRLRISTGPYVDFVFPPSGVPGSTGKFTIYGRNLPGGRPAEGVVVDGVELQQLAVDIKVPEAPDPAAIGALFDPRNAEVDGFEYRLQSPQGTSNPVLISFATGPVILEQEPNNEPEQAQKIEIPCEVVGQFNPRADVDWFTFEAKKDDVYTIELFSQRLNLPTDPYLLVQQVVTGEDGEQTIRDVADSDDRDLQFAYPPFDRPQDDPVLRFAPKEDGVYRVLVRGLYSDSRAGPHLVYRLSIRPEKPDFRLLAAVKNPYERDNNRITTFSPVLRKGGTAQVEVLAFRQGGFDGPIELSVEGLPKGVACPPAIIGAGQKKGTLVLSADEKADDWAGSIRVVGKAETEAGAVTSVARSASLVWDKLNQNMDTYARLTRDLTLAVISEPALLKAEAGDGNMLETARAGKLTVPVKVARGEGVKGDLKLDPAGLPKEIKAASVTLNDKTAEGKLEITLEAAIKPGTYSFHLTGSSKVAYGRNPEAAHKADEEKQRFAELVGKLNEAFKEADAAQKAADKAAADAAAEAKKAEDAAKQAAQAAAAAEAEAKTAADKAAQAKQAAEKASDDESLSKASAEAEKAAADAAEKAKETAEAQASAEAAVAEAADKLKAADEEKAQAAAAAKEADGRAKAAVEEQKKVDKQAADLAAAAKPKDIDVFVDTLPIVLKIADAPLNLSAKAPGGPVKQGESTEVPVSLERLYDFADEVELEVALPNGVQGLKIDKVKVAKDKKDAALKIEAGKQATPGTHKATVRATLTFHGQKLTVEQAVDLSVQEVKDE